MKTPRPHYTFTLDRGEKLWTDFDHVLVDRLASVSRRAFLTRKHGNLHVFQHRVTMPDPDQDPMKPPTPEVALYLPFNSHYTGYVHWLGGEFGDFSEDYDTDYDLPEAITCTFRHQRRGWVYGWDSQNPKMLMPWETDGNCDSLDKIIKRTEALYHRLVELSPYAEKGSDSYMEKGSRK